MGRTLSALKILDQRQVRTTADTSASARPPQEAVPDLLSRSAATNDSENQLKRIEAVLAKASLLAREFVTDKALVFDSPPILRLDAASIHVAERASDIVDVPLIQSSADTSASARPPQEAVPDLLSRSAATNDSENQLKRIEAVLAKASLLAREFVADKALVFDSPPIRRLDAASIHVAEGASDIVDVPLIQLQQPPEWVDRPVAPVWELPQIEPTRGYRELAARIAREASGSQERAPLLIAAVRGAAMDAFNLMELAVALSESGSEVLVVDSRHRAPLASGQTGHRPQVGLSHILAGSASWLDAISATSLLRVSFVGSGQLEQHDDQWQSNAENVWQHLPAHWRNVLVGGGAFDRPLTLAMAGICRSTYLIVELGRERRQAISAALSALRAAGANLRGAIALDSLRMPA